jgi:hypothetical protein
VKVGSEPVALVAFKCLESTPDHAALRARHAADEHAGVVLDVLGNKHAGLRGATRVRAGHGVGEAGSTRVAKLLDGAPCAEAGVAGFALGAVGVVTGVLVERDGLGEVRSTDDVATATAVVLAEVPCEVGLAESACVGRLVGLEGMLVFGHEGIVGQHVRCVVYVLDDRLIGPACAHVITRP